MSFKNISDLIENFKKFIKNGSYLSPIKNEHIDKLIFSRKQCNSSKKIIDSIEKVYQSTKTVKIVKDRSKIRYYSDILKQNIVLIASLIPFGKL